MNLPAENLPNLDPETAQGFTERAAEIIDHGAIAVMMAVGHRTRLFDTMGELRSSTSVEIADHAGLAERYVREWLAVMTTGRIVEYDPKDSTYTLPPEHAACLTRGGTLGNLAVYAQFVSLMGRMADKVIECFESGQGLGYGEYPRFHEVMAEDSGQTVVAQLTELLALAPELTRRLESGIQALDAGCGRGLALIALAQRFPRSRFAGCDLCADAIEHAASVAHDAGLANVDFAVRDLRNFEAPESYDFVMSFDAVHDQKDPQDLLRRLYGCLRPGGIYLMQDIGGSARLENNLGFPMASLLYAVSCTHCTPVSLAQGGQGLGTMWGWETAERMLGEAGFTAVERHVLPNDPMNVWFVAKKV